ncbi:MAG: cytochrome b/b6 domain-containing protein [Acidobacteriota bacterium]
MSLVTWGTSPWGQPVILHAAWNLLWFSLAAGAAFAVAHAVWVRLRTGSAGTAPHSPGKAGIPRHSLAARLFHWVMAAAMLTLLGTAFLPKLGLRFDWVGVHVLAGAVLVAALVFHVVHALCCMDFLSIWPESADLAELKALFASSEQETKKALPGKYPLGNKLFHLAIVVLGLTMAATGLVLLTRVRNPFLARDPYRLFSDGDWGVVYALHGLAGLALVALVIIHVYFAFRPEKRPVTKSMLTGPLDRDYYLSHHDPARWDPRQGSAPTTPNGDAVTHDGV